MIQPFKGNMRPRLHWCPTGRLALLPVHAAGIYDGPAHLQVCCADYVVSSYTPTLTTLLRAQKAAKPLQKEFSHIVLVAEKEPGEPHLQVIDHVDVEVDIIAATVSSSCIHKLDQLVGNTTISGTCEAMQNANIVHLACHGIQDSTDVLQSGFCLGDGRMTISKLMQLKLDKAFLAFLSACETAKGDVDQPDQVMHLAAAMIFTGFKTVIATMWYVESGSLF
jgi:CHAT domain-containing protein